MSLLTNMTALTQWLSSLEAWLIFTVRVAQYIPEWWLFCTAIIIGDISRFPDHKTVSKYGGIAWQENQSGDFKSTETRLIRSGNRYLKYYFTEAAKSAQVHDTIFAAYYNQKKAEPAKYAEKRALALIARKLVQMVDHLLRINRLYESKGGSRQKV